MVLLVAGCAGDDGQEGDRAPPGASTDGVGLPFSTAGLSQQDLGSIELYRSQLDGIDRHATTRPDVLADVLVLRTELQKAFLVRDMLARWDPGPTGTMTVTYRDADNGLMEVRSEDGATALQTRVWPTDDDAELVVEVLIQCDGSPCSEEVSIRRYSDGAYEEVPREAVLPTEEDLVAMVAPDCAPTGLSCVRYGLWNYPRTDFLVCDQSSLDRCVTLEWTGASFVPGTVFTGGPSAAGDALLSADSRYTDSIFGTLTGIARHGVTSPDILADLLETNGDSTAAVRVRSFAAASPSPPTGRMRLEQIDMRAGYLRAVSMGSELVVTTTHWRLPDGTELVGTTWSDCAAVCESRLGFRLFQDGAYTDLDPDDVVPDDATLRALVMPDCDPAGDPCPLVHELPSSGTDIVACDGLERARCVVLEWEEGSFSIGAVYEPGGIADASRGVGS